MILSATPTQEDVFKSISDNVGSSSSDPRSLYIVLLCGVGFVVLLVLVNSILKRRATPRAVNHQGKLIREMIKRLPLRKGEVKHLKTLAADQNCASPLTLVLCPSLLAKGINAKTKADKRVIMGVAKKMGILKKK